MDRYPLADLSKVVIVKNIKEAKTLQGIPGVQWALEDSGQYKTGKNASPYRNKVYVWTVDSVGKRGGVKYKEAQVAFLTKPAKEHGTSFQGPLPQPFLEERTTRYWPDEQGKWQTSVYGPGDLTGTKYQTIYTKKGIPRKSKIPGSALDEALEDKDWHPILLESTSTNPFDGMFFGRKKRRKSRRKKCHSRVRRHSRKRPKRKGRSRVRSHNRRRRCKSRFGYPVVSPADCVVRTFGTIDSIPGAQTPNCDSLNPMQWFTTATGNQP